MFVYNLTNKVDHSILNDWINWQKNKHIPAIMATGLFYEFKFFHLLDHDDAEGATYIIQYLTAEKNNCDIYMKDFSPAFREEALKLWGDKLIIFRSILQSVQ